MSKGMSHNHHDHDDHYFHHDVPYIEPDYYATNVNRNMPILSTVARGPRGFGVKAEIIKSDDGTFIYRLYNDETGETIFQTPNLSAGKITIKQDSHTPVPGEVAHATISVEQDGKTTSFDLYLPPGADGSRLFSVKRHVLKEKKDVYTWKIEELIYDGQTSWPSKPRPRVNDSIIFGCTDGPLLYFAVGHIRAVEGNQVVATVLSYLNIPVPYIGDNGNWWIGTEDSGIRAQGPKGDKGSFLAPSIEEIGSYENIEVLDLSDDPTEAQLHFKIPMAKMILIQEELESIDDLPPFEDTPIGYAYLVDHQSDLQYDLYYRGPGDDWIIVKNWQGVPAKVNTGETHRLPWGEPAKVVGTPNSGNEVTFDFYIPDIIPARIPGGNIAIDDRSIVVNDNGELSVPFDDESIVINEIEPDIIIIDTDLAGVPTNIPVSIKSDMFADWVYTPDQEGLTYSATIYARYDGAVVNPRNIGAYPATKPTPSGWPTAYQSFTVSADQVLHPGIVYKIELSMYRISGMYNSGRAALEEVSAGAWGVANISEDEILAITEAY